jgi:hypothetical protein
MAHRERSEHFPMEGAGQRSMKAAVYHAAVQVRRDQEPILIGMHLLQ